MSETMRYDWEGDVRSDGPSTTADEHGLTSLRAGVLLPCHVRRLSGHTGHTDEVGPWEVVLVVEDAEAFCALVEVVLLVLCTNESRKTRERRVRGKDGKSAGWEVREIETY